MKVRCIATKAINPPAGLEQAGWTDVHKLVTVGKEYEVYAIHSSWLCGGLWYMLLHDFDDVQYIPARYFEVTDSSKPAFWRVSPDDPHYEGPEELGPEHYEALVDGDTETVSAFDRIRALMAEADRFEYIGRDDLDRLREEHPDDLYVFLDGNIQGELNLIETIYRSTGNAYTERNWDGLREALGTLGWIKDRTVRFVHFGLPVLDEADWSTYLSILLDASKGWTEGLGREYAEALHLDVHFCFLKSLRPDIEWTLYKMYP